MNSLFRKIFIFTAAVFSGVSLYQHWLLKYSGGSAKGFCDAKGVIGCSSVSVSPWAEPFFGLPIAAMALGLLLLIFIFEFIPKYREKTSSLYFILGTGSLLYLAIMLFVVRQICPLCLVTHICIWTAIILKFYKSSIKPKLDWVYGVGIIIPILFAAILTHFGLPALRNQMNWERMQITDYDFKSVTTPQAPKGSPTITLGNAAKKIPMIVASDFMCLHCREHFFELSRALAATGKAAEITILLDPLDNDCNAGGGNQNPGACHAARVGLCQFKNGKFDSFFKNIYLSPGRAMSGTETLITMESKTPEEQKQLESCVKSKETQVLLDQNLNVIYQTNTLGTPVTWVGGYQFTGRLGWKDWDEIFRRIR